MKKLLLTFGLLFCFFFEGKSQAYTPFSDSTSYWQVLNEHCGACYYGPGMGCVCGKKNYFFEGDTIIGSFTYKKVFNLYQSYNPWTGYSTGSKDFIGGIRNDVPNKKVYLYDITLGHDTLLYDFNLNIGDTLTKSFVYDKVSGIYGYVTIDSIDFININGNIHKRYRLNGAGYGPGQAVDYLIEGIGSTFGLLEPIEAFFEDMNFLECFKYDIGVDYYGQSGCNVVTDIQQHPLDKMKLDVFPNPLVNTSTLTINYGSSKQKNIVIYNSIGETIKQFNTSNNSIFLYHHEFSSGLYFISVFDELNQATSIKLVVN